MKTVQNHFLEYLFKNKKYFHFNVQDAHFILENWDKKKTDCFVQFFCSSISFSFYCSTKLNSGMNN